MIVWIKYVFKKNRDTDYYDIGAKWFGNYKVTWNKWLFGRRFVIVCLKKFKQGMYDNRI